MSEPDSREAILAELRSNLRSQMAMQQAALESLDRLESTRDTGQQLARRPEQMHDIGQHYTEHPEQDQMHITDLQRSQQAGSESALHTGQRSARRPEKMRSIDQQYIVHPEQDPMHSTDLQRFQQAGSESALQTGQRSARRPEQMRGIEHPEQDPMHSTDLRRFQQARSESALDTGQGSTHRPEQARNVGQRYLEHSEPESMHGIHPRYSQQSGFQSVHETGQPHLHRSRQEPTYGTEPQHFQQSGSTQRPGHQHLHSSEQQESPGAGREYPDLPELASVDRTGQQQMHDMGYISNRLPRIRDSPSSMAEAMPYDSRMLAVDKFLSESTLVSVDAKTCLYLVEHKTRTVDQPMDSSDANLAPQSNTDPITSGSQTVPGLAPTPTTMLHAAPHESSLSIQPGNSSHADTTRYLAASIVGLFVQVEMFTRNFLTLPFDNGAKKPDKAKFFIAAMKVLINPHHIQSTMNNEQGYHVFVGLINRILHEQVLGLNIYADIKNPLAISYTEKHQAYISHAQQNPMDIHGRRAHCIELANLARRLISEQDYLLHLNSQIESVRTSIMKSIRDFIDPHKIEIREKIVEIVNMAFRIAIRMSTFCGNLSITFPQPFTPFDEDRTMIRNRDQLGNTEGPYMVRFGVCPLVLQETFEDSVYTTMLHKAHVVVMTDRFARRESHDSSEQMSIEY